MDTGNRELSADEILLLKDQIYNCAQSFRQDAYFLMHLMSKTFSIDLETLDGLHELKFKKSVRQRGKLNEEWTYFLHGGQCQFENVQTGQIVEITVVTAPEFGCLDGYFLYNYMLTTDKYKKLAEALATHLNVWRAIDLLAEKGILTQLSHLPYPNIIAL